LLYVGDASGLVDPYTKLERNLVRIRVEIERLLHVRNIDGALVLDAPALDG
jgi:hypothetical protein